MIYLSDVRNNDFMTAFEEFERCKGNLEKHRLASEHKRILGLSFLECCNIW